MAIECKAPYDTPQDAQRNASLSNSLIPLFVLSLQADDTFQHNDSSMFNPEYDSDNGFLKHEIAADASSEDHEFLDAHYAEARARQAQASGWQPNPPIGVLICGADVNHARVSMHCVCVCVCVG